MRRNDVIRTWHLPKHRTVVHVSTRHPKYGELFRGRIELRRGTWTWVVTDYDHNHIGDFAGDYIDAERALLAATAELDPKETRHSEWSEADDGPLPRLKSLSDSVRDHMAAAQQQQTRRPRRRPN